MKFRDKFIEKICGLYYQKTLVNSTPVHTTNSESKVPKLPLGNDKEAAEILLQTDEGFLSLQSFLVSHQQLYLDQVTFQSILASILEEYDEFDAIEIFDILETSGNGVLTIKEFYVFTLLQAAIENEQALICLYYHGTLIFDVISGSQGNDTQSTKCVNGDRIQSILRIVGYDEFEIQAKLDMFEVTATSPVNFDTFQSLLYVVFKEINKTLIDIDISDEEIKMAKCEIEEKNFLDDPYRTEEKASARDAVSPTPLKNEMMNFVDQFHDLNDDNEDNERKEVTNMPLANPDHDSNLYETKGYSTNQVSNSKALLQNSKTNKDSIAKYYDPYVDRQSSERPITKAKPIKDAKGDSKGSQNTDNEQVHKKNIDDQDRVGCCGKKKCVIF